MTFLEYILQTADRVLALDTEFKTDQTGTHPKNVLCYVYKDLKTGEIYRFTKENRFGNPHFDLDNSLVVCHYALAECGSFLSDLIPIPKNIWCTWTEEKNVNNAYTNSFSLLDTAARYNFKDTMKADDKNYWRDLIINNDSFTDEEMIGVMDYCQQDVEMTAHVFLQQVQLIQERFKLKSKEDFDIYFDQALRRGRAHCDYAKIYNVGIPVNNSLLSDFKTYWSAAKKQIIQEFNQELQCFDDYSFNLEKFGELLKRENLFNDWPRTMTGKLECKTKYLENHHSPIIKKVGEVKKLLSQTNLQGFNISENGRAKAALRPFSTQTGRCAPGGSDFCFNASKWLRHFVKAPHGKVLAYLDYKSQEFAIQGYLSGDEKMIESYSTGDPYVANAKMAGDIPEYGSKSTHPKERKVWKEVTLANSYGMGHRSLAPRIQKSVEAAKGILRKFKFIFKIYFKWIQQQLDNAERDLKLRTVFGWTLHITKYKRLTATSYQNYPIQSNGAEIIRNAVRVLHDNNFMINATVHDAVLIEVYFENWKQFRNEIKRAKELMVKAANEVIGGDVFVDHEFIKDKGIKSDKVGKEMFIKILGAITTAKQNYKSSSSGQYINKYIYK